MALVIADRVQQTGTANTTVSFTLSGSVTGYQAFTAIGNGNTTYYSSADQSGNWEVGIGTYSTTGPTLTRTTILSSSNSGSAVTFSGTVTVFCTYPSEKSVNLDANGVAVIGTGTALGGTTNPIIAAVSGANNYIQQYIYNSTNGVSSSADFVAYASNSTDSHGWADMGFTSPTYADTLYTCTGPNEAYLFGSALNSSYTGNLVYATDSTGSQNYHQWYVGGFTQAKSAFKMQLTSTGLQVANSFGVGTAGSGTTGEIRATNNITAYYSSDLKFKENVQPIQGASEIIRAIGADYFDWTDAYIAEHGGADGYFVQKSDFGVIAQKVQKAFPKAVRTRPDGSLAVDYEKLGVLAFPAIVEILDRLDALEAKELK